MREEFARNLLEARQRAGISQRAAAEALQVSQALLSHYEKGIREPGLDFVVRAAGYYKMSTDALLGQQDICCPPVPYAQQVEQELKDAMTILLDMLNRNYDQNVYCYATVYLAEVLYELLRHFHRNSEEYDPEIYHLAEESFLSGAVASDISWVRTQYIMALRQYKERVGPILDINPEIMKKRYGPALSSMLTLLRLAGQRISRQDEAEGTIHAEMFTLPRPRPENVYFAPEEEQTT